MLITALCLAGPGCSLFGSDDDGELDTTAPTAPSGLTGASGDSVIELTWDAVGADDLDGYNVYRSESAIDLLSNVGPHNESLVSDATFSDGEARNGTTYYYVVTAVDIAANESEPSEVVDKTPFTDPPDRP